MPRTKLWLLLLVACGLSLSHAASAAPSIDVAKHVQADKETDVRIAADTAMRKGNLFVTYRPGSAVKEVAKLPIPPLKAGQIHSLKWTPKDAAIVRLDYILGDDPKKPAVASTLVGVTFATTPVSGVMVMVLAGLILFGGCWFAFRLLTTSGDE